MVSIVRANKSEVNDYFAPTIKTGFVNLHTIAMQKGTLFPSQVYLLKNEEPLRRG
jgi:hypothetical protein